MSEPRRTAPESGPPALPGFRLLGSGLIHAAVTALLPPEAPDPSGGSRVLLSAHDTWDPGRDDALAERGRAHLGWLPLRATPAEIVIGPLTRPDEPGCHRCAARREERVRADGESRTAWLRQFRDLLATRTPRNLTPLAAHLAAVTAVGELRLLASDPDALRTHHGLLAVELDTLAVRAHRFRPEPGCPCARTPDDDRTAGELVLRPAPGLAPGVLRGQDLRTRLPGLRRDFVDARTGVVRDLRLDGTRTVPTVEAAVGLSGRARPEFGLGRGFDVRTAQATALAECLERLGGWSPQARRTIVRGTYRDLAPDALDPVTVGLYPAERHREIGPAFQPYEATLEIPWVWGYSFRRRRPVLVPEALAYYGTAANGGGRPFVQETSSGCAVGGSLAEAVLHGLLEVAERDALMITWTARLAVPRVDLRSAGDRRIPMLAERIAHSTGYDVQVHATTVEHGVPTFLALATDRGGRAGRPAHLCAGGSGPNAEAAVLGALGELTTMIDVFPRYYADRRREAERMVDDPAAVREMLDHLLLYSHPAASHRFDFLEERTRTTFADLSARWPWPDHPDLRLHAEEIAARFLDVATDVVVVDQTGPDHHRAGVHCVKTIVPGAVPLTFGHAFRRTDGLPRLTTLPRLLGHRAGDLAPEDFNPHPHPYP
ncbi:TOMM precursor leader peptide-binding protein [Streptomyces sp. NPDC055607]